jgi:predicted nucleic acid-binding protein
MSHLVLLDNEAVQALAEPTHPKHRRVLSHAQVVAHRTRRQAPIRVAVPTSVRVEAGWDRTAPASALLNQLRVADIALDTASANIAAAIVARTGVSVADAHLGAVMRAAADDQLTVITSDPNDMRSVAAPRNLTTVAI